MSRLRSENEAMKIEVMYKCESKEARKILLQEFKNTEEIALM